MRNLARPLSFSGFALLEILASAALLIGLFALFINFSHSRKQEEIITVTGKHLGYVVNNIIKESAVGGTCDHTTTAQRPLTECIVLSDSIKKQLENDHIDVDNSYVYTSNEANSSSSYVTLALSGKFTSKAAAGYAEIIFNQLTAESLWHFSFKETSADLQPIYKYSVKDDGGFASYSFYVNY